MTQLKYQVVIYGQLLQVSQIGHPLERYYYTTSCSLAITLKALMTKFLVDGSLKRAINEEHAMLGWKLRFDDLVTS